jgi:drug/metabolite transporter (DMT)-like permease
MKPFVLIMINVLLLVGGQILWKLSLSRAPLGSLQSIPSALLQPYLLLGCVLYGVATIIWFYALSRYDLSRVYPLQSVAYILGAISGLLVFKEQISSEQWFGLALLSGGAYFLAK